MTTIEEACPTKCTRALQLATEGVGQEKRIKARTDLANPLPTNPATMMTNPTHMHFLRQWGFRSRAG